MTVIAIGSDQPTKQEIPVDVLASSKYVCDLVSQTSQIGELRSAIAAVRLQHHPDILVRLGPSSSNKVFCGRE
jgi:ornithine cyclodeaminase/alanine dehydrogenase-like protein (mu-crystallin family)